MTTKTDLTDRTRDVLRRDVFMHAFGQGRNGMICTVWYSKIDGTIYGLGGKNPNSGRRKYNPSQDLMDSEEDCMRIKVDRFGLVPEEVSDTYLNQEVSNQICGNECDYAKSRVLDQIRENRKEILTEKFGSRK